MTSLSGIRSGAIAGVISSFVFTALHDLLISDIWSTTALMLAAGAVCGLCLGWTYALLIDEPSIRSWLRYNFVYLAMFVLLGIGSVLIYEPVTTIAALIEADAPPSALFSEALLLIVGFTVAISILLSRIYAQNWRHSASIFLTCSVLMLLLGLNVSVIGLVFVPSSSFYLIAELFGLIVVLDVVYVIAFVAIERNLLIKIVDPAGSA